MANLTLPVSLELDWDRIKEHRNQRLGSGGFSFFSHWFCKESDSSETLEVVKAWGSQPRSPLQMLCEKKEIIALHKTRTEYFMYMEMRTESDPVTPKVSVPSKRKWEKAFYLWRNAINKYYEGCEYVD